VITAVALARGAHSAEAVDDAVRQRDQLAVRASFGHALAAKPLQACNS
jgi:hypothetical protein